MATNTDSADGVTRNRATDVSEISTGTSPQSEAEAQAAPPGGQTPALDPTPVKNLDKAAAAGELDAGAMWPRDPAGPHDPEGDIAPFSSAMVTGQSNAEPETDTKVVTPAGEQESKKSSAGTQKKKS